MQEDLEWPDEYNEQVMLYLQTCVPRQLARPNVFSIEWWPIYPAPFRPDDWRHRWPEGATWPHEWWTVEQLTSRLQTLALLRACSVQSLAPSGSGPPEFDTWVAQGPSWLLKGTREMRFSDRHTPVDHTKLCEHWLTAEHREEWEQDRASLQQDMLEWVPYSSCDHVTLSSSVVSAKELYLLLGGKDCYGLHPYVRPAAIEVGGHMNTGTCAECFKREVKLMVQNRFADDSDEFRQEWFQ